MTQVFTASVRCVLTPTLFLVLSVKNTFSLTYLASNNRGLTKCKLRKGKLTINFTPQREKLPYSDRWDPRTIHGLAQLVLLNPTCPP